jgi:hypothetical protein
LPLKLTVLRMEDEKLIVQERPNAFWNRVYIAVIATTVVVVTLLWAFSRYFS